MQSNICNIHTASLFNNLFIYTGCSADSTFVRQSRMSLTSSRADPYRIISFPAALSNLLQKI